MAFNIFILLIFVQFGRPQEFFPFLNPLRLAMLFTLVALFLTIVNKEHFSLTEAVKIKESKLYLFFFLIMMLGVPFAYHRRNAFDFVLLKYIANFIFFFLLVVNVQSIDRLKKVLFAVCVAVLFLASMSLMHGDFRYGRFYPGTMYDPNDLAYFLVSFLPIFFVLMRKSEPIMNKIISISGILLSLVAILLTGSRGGLLGLGVVLFFILFSKIVIKRKSVKIFLCLVAGFTISMHADKIDMERLQSIFDLSSDYNLTSDTGRLGIWKRGLSLAMSNPMTGVGVVCFGKAIGEQRSGEGEIPRWQSAHSSYVQVLAETGFIGFWIFASLMVACLQNFYVLSKRRENEKLVTGYANIPGIFMIGLCGTMVCGFFLTQGYSLIFTFYFAISAALRNLFVQGGLNGV
ncbi:MAG: hypothetical protein HF978_04750 [Desulfobacteraceae bacterium]|nr:O-antigen ligase family protein [Desulfobacteraceae bacterium]MBC2754839.1 hypothetical protein [Desulfobacteraceae bacterium]